MQKILRWIYTIMCWDKLSLGALGLKLQTMETALIGGSCDWVIDKLHLKDIEKAYSI